MFERWLNKPNKLKELIHANERREWIKEIEHTRGYLLICTAVENEIEWCNKNMRVLVADKKFAEAERIENWMSALEFLKSAILQWNADGDVAHDVLFTRLKALDEMKVEVSTQAQPNVNVPS